MPPLPVLLAAIFGAATAAFLPRLADRLAVGFGEPPRSGCAICLRPFPPGIPGWVRTGPSCPCRGAPHPQTFPLPPAGATQHRPALLRVPARATQHRPAPPRVPAWATQHRPALLRVVAGAAERQPAPLLVPAGAGVAALLAVRLGPVPLLPVYLVGAVFGLLLAAIDVRCRRLPDPLVGALTLVLGVPSAILRPEGTGRALLAGVALLVAYLLIALLPRRGLGLGDVKLAASLGLILGFAGWPTVLAAVVAAHLINGLVAAFLLLTRQIERNATLPFGPALLAGALIALTFD